jgi:hypothetical protein
MGSLVFKEQVGSCPSDTPFSVQWGKTGRLAEISLADEGAIGRGRKLFALAKGFWHRKANAAFGPSCLSDAGVAQG